MGLFLKLSFGLSFLDPSDIDDCFINDIVAIQPNDNRIHAIYGYFLETFMVANRLF